jgi:hypothetical protein
MREKSSSGFAEKSATSSQQFSYSLSVMLGEEDFDDLHAVAVEADKSWAIHAHQQHTVKKGYRFSHPQPGCHLTKLSLAGNN